MSRYRTALGEEFLIERRLPRTGWHGTSDTSLLDLSDIGDGGLVGTLRVSRELLARCDAGAFRGAVLEQSRAAK